MTLLEMSSLVFLGACVAVAATFGAVWIGWPGGVLGGCAAVAAIYGFFRFASSREENSRPLTRSARRLEFICFCLFVAILESATAIGLYHFFRSVGFAAVLLAPLVLLGAMSTSAMLADVVTTFCFRSLQPRTARTPLVLEHDDDPISP